MKKKYFLQLFAPALLLCSMLFILATMAYQMHLRNQQADMMIKIQRLQNDEARPQSKGHGIPVIDISALKTEAWKGYNTTSGSKLTFEEWDKQVWRKQYDNH